MMNNTPLIVNINNFDINRVTFVKNPVKPNRPTMFSLKYDDQKFKLRLPTRMSTRFSQMKDEKTGEMSYSLSATLKDCHPMATQRAEGNTEFEKLYNMVVFDLKEKLIDTATKNSVEWFKRELKREQVEFIYKDMFKLSQTKNKSTGLYEPNGIYAPNVRVKIPVYENKQKVKVVTATVVDYARNDVDVSPETLEEVFGTNMEVNMVVTPSVYAGATGWGLTFRLEYAQIFPVQRITAKDVFGIEEPAVATQQSNTYVDEEEQEEQEQEEEQVVTTPPKPATPPQLPAAPARKKRSAV